MDEYLAVQPGRSWISYGDGVAVGSATGGGSIREANPLTHSPGGMPHPQFILDYLAAFLAANPNSELPQVWDRRNGWVNFDGKSYRRSAIERMTAVLLQRAVDAARPDTPPQEK